VPRANELGAARTVNKVGNNARTRDLFEKKKKKKNIYIYIYIYAPEMDECSIECCERTLAVADSRGIDDLERHSGLIGRSMKVLLVFFAQR